MCPQYEDFGTPSHINLSSIKTGHSLAPHGRRLRTSGDPPRGDTTILALNLGQMVITWLLPTDLSDQREKMDHFVHTDVILCEPTAIIRKPLTYLFQQSKASIKLMIVR